MFSIRSTLWRRLGPVLVLAGMMMTMGLLGQVHAQQQEAFYPTYEQIVARLQQIQANFPHIVQLREIGRSSHGKPIMAVKISDNAAQEEDEPAWLFLGIIHGNEPLGLKTGLKLIHDLTQGYGSDSEITDWVNAYEIWFVPVLNIWGYENVRRKNGNQPGVDLNRNYDFRWELCVRPGEPCRDPNSGTYSGSAPFSEPETQAMRDLALQQRFVFGIDYHHGLPNPETIILQPWGGGTGAGNPPPPDRPKLAEFARSYSQWVMSSRQTGGFCQASSSIVDPTVCRAPSVGWTFAAGQGPNWYYAETGTIAYVVEIAQRTYSDRYFYTSDPNDDDPRSVQAAEEYVRNLSDGIKHWMRNFLYEKQGDQLIFRGPGITGRVTDAKTGQPVQAQIEIAGLINEQIKLRTSDPQFGRFYRFLAAGTYTVNIFKEGYHRLRRRPLR